MFFCIFCIFGFGFFGNEKSSAISRAPLLINPKNTLFYYKNEEMGAPKLVLHLARFGQNQKNNKYKFFRFFCIFGFGFFGNEKSSAISRAPLFVNPQNALFYPENEKMGALKVVLHLARFGQNQKTNKYPCFRFVCFCFCWFVRICWFFRLLVCS